MQSYSLRSQQLKKWLNQPIPFLHNTTDKWILILFLSVYVPVFLVLFQPFGVNNYDPNHQIDGQFLFLMSLFGLLMFLTMSFNEFVLAAFLVKQPKNRVQLFFWLIWTFVFIGSSIFLFYNYLGNFHDWSWQSYFAFLRDVSNMNILPFAIIFLYFHYRSYKVKYTSLIQRHHNSSLLNFKSENGKETFSINPQQLLYIASEDNYISIFHLKNQEVKKVLLRSSLKKVATDFSDTALFRCHRSYIVNLEQIRQLRANNRKMELTLLSGEIVLPVSRRYSGQLQAILAPS